MRLLKTNSLVKAEIGYVYKYLCDLDNLYNDINYLKENNEVKVVRTECGVEFIGKKKELLFKMVNIEYKNNYGVRLKVITEGKHLKRFGNADIICHLSYANNTTNIETVVMTDKTPRIIWRAFIKLMVFIYMFQPRNIEKAYIKRIEEQFRSRSNKS